MRKLIPVIIIAVLAMIGYDKYQRTKLAAEEPQEEVADFEEEDIQPEADEPRNAKSRPEDDYECDGRTRCREFKTCREATWFVEHCPGTKMDGDKDGIPCEDQLCGHH